MSTVVAPVPAYTPVSACGAGCLPKAGTTPLVGWPVRILRLAALVGTLAAGIGVALVIGFLSGRSRAWLTRRWFRLVLRSAGVRLAVQGDVSTAAAGVGTLVAANHVSWLDIPALLAVQAMTVVAKTDVREWPVIGLLAARGGTVFIDRRRLLRLPSTVAAMASSLRAGHSVLVFPEGTTWCGRTHGRFHRAAFQAAIDAAAPVRPVLLRYRLANGTATTAAAFVGDDTLFDSVLRVVSVRGLVIDVDLGAPAPSGPGRSRREVAAGTASTIRDAALAARTSPMPSLDDTDCVQHVAVRQPDAARHAGSRR